MIVEKNFLRSATEMKPFPNFWPITALSTRKLFAEMYSNLCLLRINIAAIAAFLSHEMHFKRNWNGWLLDLAFFTDITLKGNDLNFKLQRKDCEILNMICSVKGFQSKLELGI